MKPLFKHKGFEHAVAMELCRREGKKVQVNIAQMKEIVRCLTEMIWEDRNILRGLENSAVVRGLDEIESERTKGNKTTVPDMRGAPVSKSGLCGNKLPAKPSARKGSVSKVRGRGKGKVK